VGHDARHDRKTGSVGRRGSAPRRPARACWAHHPRRRPAYARRTVYVCCASSCDRLPGHRRQGDRSRLGRRPSRRYGPAISRSALSRCPPSAASSSIATAPSSPSPSPPRPSTPLPTCSTTPRPLPGGIAAALKLKWGRVYRRDRRSRSGFTYVDRRRIPALADKATALGLPGVASYVEEKRVYPLEHGGRPGGGLRRHRRPRPGRRGVRIRQGTGRYTRAPGGRAGSGRPGAACHAVRCRPNRDRTCA